jgi:hypothetical protein
MYIYLDESGNLDFDFSKKGATQFFVITLLIIEKTEVNNYYYKSY